MDNVWTNCDRSCANFVYNLLFYSSLHLNLFKGCFVDCDRSAVSGNQEPQPESVLPSQPSVARVECEDGLEPNSEVKFSVHSLQSEA